MTKSHLDASLLSQLGAIDPAEVLEKAAALRERSRKCADLAEDCVTPGGRCVLNQMSRELRQEADGLEGGLVRMRELFLDMH